MRKSNPKHQLNKLLAHIDGAYAENTLRAYKADMSEFIEYCVSRGKKSLPATPEVIASFLLDASNTRIKSATIRRKVASISAIHRLSNLADPTKHSEVKLAVRKIQRKLGTKFKQAYPVTASVLARLLQACATDLRGMRNKALLLIAYDSMRRRSELVSLRVGDLVRDSDGLISILLRKSKTDQEGTGQWIHLGAAATTALENWLNLSKIRDGFILRGISPTNEVQGELSAGQIGRVFKCLAKKAGLCSEAIEGISGHSMRVGGAQDLLIKGASLPQIMVKGGWVKTDTALRYIERLRRGYLPAETKAIAPYLEIL